MEVTRSSETMVLHTRLHSVTTQKITIRPPWKPETSKVKINLSDWVTYVTWGSCQIRLIWERFLIELSQTSSFLPLIWSHCYNIPLVLGKDSGEYKLRLTYALFTEHQTHSHSHMQHQLRHRLWTAFIFQPFSSRWHGLGANTETGWI
jgi:hypothetical protein